MDALLLQSIWFFLLLLMFAVYSVLDSFDLGIGMLIPFAKNHDVKKKMFASITPFWDGNEVWLIIAGGSLFAIFSQAYATVLSGFYIPVLLLMVALIFRAISLEYWHLSNRSRWIWEWTFCVGSALIVFVLCVALGNVVGGIPLNAEHVYMGSLWGLSGILPLTLGILGISLCIIHGMLHAAGKIPEFTAQIKSFTMWVTIMQLTSVLFVVFLIVNRSQTVSRPLFWVACVAIVGLPFILRYYRGKGSIKAAFTISSAMISGVWLLIASVHYPVLVFDSNTLQNHSLTILNSSADLATMKVVFFVAAGGILIFGLLTFINYKLFRGPVSQTDSYATVPHEELSNANNRNDQQRAEIR